MVYEGAWPEQQASTVTVKVIEFSARPTGPVRAAVRDHLHNLVTKLDPPAAGLTAADPNLSSSVRNSIHSSPTVIKPPALLPQ